MCEYICLPFFFFKVDSETDWILIFIVVVGFYTSLLSKGGKPFDMQLQHCFWG